MVIATDANGFQTLSPAPDAEYEGAVVIQENTELTSGFVTLLQNESQAVSVTNYSTSGDGSTNDYDALVLAEAAAFAAGAWLLFPLGTYLTESDLTFRVPVLFAGGVLKLAAGVTVTFNEPYMNPVGAQCFDEQARVPDTAGGVRVALTSPQSVVSPLDWGAVLNVADAYLPIQQAIDSFDYTPSADKVGTVLFPSGEYKVTKGVFVGYDFVNYPDVARALICKADNASTPQGRKQRVNLLGVGKVQITGSESPPPATNPYLLYFAGSGSGEGASCIDGITFNGNSWRWRGAYVSNMAYADTLQNLIFRATLGVGLDWIDCWVSRLINIFCSSCCGHAVRTSNANTCSGDTIIAWGGKGHRDSMWPDPTETFIVDHQGAIVQTLVADRTLVRLSGNNSNWRTVNCESNDSGSPLQVTSVTGLRTVTESNHGLAATDPVWVADAPVTKAQTVASVTSSSVFVLSADSVNGTRNLIYRRATSITKADPAVVNCKNHGLATGCRVKIISGSAPAGMVELEANGPWYVITKIDDDSYSLQDLSGYTAGTGLLTAQAQGTTAIVGNGTQFTTDYTVNNDLVINHGTLGWRTYRISLIADNTHLTIVGGLAEASLATDSPYKMGVNVDSSGYADSDGSEYIVHGYPGVYFDSDAGRLETVRFESNILPYSKILTPSGLHNATIDGMLIADQKTNDIDSWVIESRDYTTGCRFSNFRGSGVWRAAVLFRLTGTSYAVGNNVDGVSLFLSQPAYATPTEIVEFDITSTGWQEANCVAGAWTPVNIPDDDATPPVNTIPSVWGDYAGNNVLGYWGSRVNGPVLSVASANARDITNFDDGRDGQIIFVRFMDANATLKHDAAKIVLTGGVDLTPAANALVQFHNVAGVWYQI